MIAVTMRVDKIMRPCRGHQIWSLGNEFEIFFARSRVSKLCPICAWTASPLSPFHNAALWGRPFQFLAIKIHLRAPKLFFRHPSCSVRPSPSLQTCRRQCWTPLAHKAKRFLAAPSISASLRNYYGRILWWKLKSSHLLKHLLILPNVIFVKLLL